MKHRLAEPDALRSHGRAALAQRIGVRTLDRRRPGGNVYVNRGTTGAVVRRQPFGGWKRSSVGPTAKAGGANYVNCLRQLAPGPRRRPRRSLRRRRAGSDVASLALDESGLEAERNFVRYRHYSRPIVVRLDETLLAGSSSRYLADSHAGRLALTSAPQSPYPRFRRPAR